MNGQVNSVFFFETQYEQMRHPHYGRFLRLEPDRLGELPWLTSAKTLSPWTSDPMPMAVRTFDLRTQASPARNCESAMNKHGLSSSGNSISGSRLEAARLKRIRTRTIRAVSLVVLAALCLPVTA